MHPPNRYRTLSLLVGELYDMPCNLVIISETEHLAAILSFFLISIASAGMESNTQDEEARAQAKAFYDRTVKQCGDLHYVWLEWPSSFMMQPPYWVLVQYKGLNIQISPRALSEADRLNGLE
jgi:hypothetical protein